MANFPKAMMVAENYATLYIPFEVVQNTQSIQLVFIFLSISSYFFLEW